jgi:hypothetical protein
MRRARYSVKLAGEFVRFAREKHIYWLIPLILMLVMAGVLIVSSQGAAPLLYTLF